MAEHHPRRKDKEIADGEEMERILLAGKYAVIGMASGDEPYAVPLSYGYDRTAGRMYFNCAPEGLKIDFARKNPKVCATVVEDLDEKKRGMDVLLRHLEGDPDPIQGKHH
jgi:uncharacterized protein